MKKTAGRQIMRFVSGIVVLMLLGIAPFAAAWQKGEPESERRAALKVFPRLIADAENNPAGQLEVGYLYAQGISGRPDYVRAVQWYQKAAAGGNHTAMYLLAVMHIEGLGTRRNYATALQWAQKMADSGDASGYMLLGILYESGSGVARDDAKAAQYYGYATREVRDIGARYRLGMLNLEGRGVPRNRGQAMEWLESAASLGDRHAHYQLGYMYFTGTAVVADDTRSGIWFEKTLVSDGVVSRGRFPDIFGAAGVPGEGYTKNMQRMMKKDPHINRNARFMLGRIYEKFGDVPLNMDCAKAYYAMAARAGHPEAKKRLAAIKKAELKKEKERKRVEKEAAKKQAEQEELAGKAAAAKSSAVMPSSEPTAVADMITPHSMRNVGKAGSAKNGVSPEISQQVHPSSFIPVLTVHNAGGIAAIRRIQETDGIGEVIGIFDNPVSLVVMDMIAVVRQWSRDGKKDKDGGVVDVSGKESTDHGH